MRVEPEILRECRVLAGPTASGKSAVALELAERIGAEIVSLDSMTIYRGMDIGTAKPTAAERARVPHHLFNQREPWEEYSLADYLREATACCREILARGRIPLLVGGTGMYLRGWLRGVFDGPPADWDLRNRLEAEAAVTGSETLHARLREIDPITAGRIAATDLRRIVRALEVYELTGRPLSSQQQEGPLPPADRPRQVVWLSPPRDWLRARIDLRVEQMFAAGWVDEVRGLLAAARPWGRTAAQALGYQEIAAFLRGAGTEAETISQIQTRTRQFAKRQETWFRNLVECQPLPMTGSESPGELAEKLATPSP